MPPRRTRTSLPTPAASVASTENTPRPTRRSTYTDKNGLVTPISMSDGDGVHDDRTEASVETGDGDADGMIKRKASDDTPTSRQTFDGVELPSRRSRLTFDKTGLNGDLELGSPVSKRAKLALHSAGEREHGVPPSSDPLDLISPVLSTFPKTARTSRAQAKAAAQPFNVGKYSKVAKASASDLALDADDMDVDGKPTPTARARRSLGTSTPTASASRGKANGPARGKAVKQEPAESEYEDVVQEEYAMDSDAEERQMKAAIQASAAKGMEEKFGSASSTAMTSRASSVGGKGNTKTPVKKRESVGRRAAVLRSAEKRRALMDSANASDASPSDDSESEFGGSVEEDDSEGALTALSSDGESAFENQTPASSAKGRSRGAANGKSKVKAAPRASAASAKSKATGKAATKQNSRSKSTKAFAGKGRKLDAMASDGSDYNASDASDNEYSGSGAGSEDDAGDDADMAEEDFGALDDDETREMTIMEMKKRRREDRKAYNKGMESIRKEEAKMKKELGRKLTNGEKNIIRLVKHHPELDNVWGDLAATVPPVKPEVMDAHPALKLTLLPFQKESLYWMRKQEEGVWKGGMLADEMGMGKTIQTIALLLSEPRRKPSLVVAPVVALMQWKHEIENNTDNFTVCVWHGQGRMKAADLKKYDVVLVSYGTLEASFRRQQRGFKRGDVFIKEKSPMHSFEWFRVILDEAHNIKERSTNAAKAAFALQAQYKWCLSGTPLQNRVGELYSLVRFLGADPFSHYFCKKCPCKSLHWKFSDKRHCDECKHKPMDHVCFWNTEILTPIARYGIESGGPGHTAFKKLKILLDRMMLRRTKLERADDLGLPPRTIVVRRDYFSPEEKELYMSLFTGAKRQFSTYISQGTVLNNYSNIFSLITRMRQMACHPDLVLRSKTSSLKAIDVDQGNVCRLCQDSAEDAIVSACKHVFDRECIRQYLEVQQLRGHRPECPVCHIEISIDLEQEAVELETDSKKARQGILSRLDINNWRSSSKLEALVEELEKLRNQDCTIKSLVFSQFVSFLDLIAFRLQRAGFNICRLEGGMTPQQRDATIQHFMNNTGVTVFLISLKAGGVALNLTEASMVFMMDSWWNPSVEYQAMDRIHRLGQKRPVKVVKLVVEDSIEDQIVQLQHKKLAMTEAALNKDPDAALGKLTVEDLGFLFKM